MSGCAPVCLPAPPCAPPTPQVVVPDQKLPVCFSLRAHVTTTDLLFSPPKLSFGPCVMAEDTGVVRPAHLYTYHFTCLFLFV